MKLKKILRDGIWIILLSIITFTITWKYLDFKNSFYNIERGTVRTITLNNNLNIIEIRTDEKGNKYATRGIVKPGEYEMRRIENPADKNEEDWVVFDGTLIGCPISTSWKGK
jgi:hypothetical protein